MQYIIFTYLCDLHFLLLCISFCGLKQPSNVSFSQPERLPLVFPVMQICKQHITSVIVYMACSPFRWYFWNAILLGIGLLVGRIIIYTLHMSAYQLPASIASNEMSVFNLVAVPLYVLMCFPLLAFKFFFLSLAFNSLTMIYLGMISFSYHIRNQLSFWICSLIF